MKRIALIIFAIVLVVNSAIAQDTPLKNFRFGLKVAPIVTWMTPDDVKQFTNIGAKVKFNYGLITEFKLTKTASFSTGFDFNTYGGKIDFKNATSRYYVQDISNKDTTAYYYISSRVFRMKTYELPLTLKLRTPEIGALTYFGQFGVNLGVRGKVKANDEGSFKYLIKKAATSTTLDTLVNGVAEARPDNIITDDMNLIRLGLNVGIGAEYNLAGSTSLLLSINYYNSFLNSLKAKSKEIQAFNGKSFANITQNVKANGIVINIGFMF